MKQLKRGLWLGPVLAVAAVLAWMFLERGAPTYRVFKTPPVIPAYTHLQYPFMAREPFDGGRTWISTWISAPDGTTRSWHCYYFDLEAGRILGELKGASPVFETKPGQLLCVNRAPGLGFSHRLALVLKRISGGRLRISSSQKNDVETCWLIDLATGRATRLGEAVQFPGAGSSFHPSPDRRFAFNKSTGQLSNPDVLLFDAGTRSIRTILMNGWPLGWWSNEEILFKPNSNDYMLYNVVTGRQSGFLLADEFGEFFRREKVDGYPKEVSIFPMWNGREYDFYFTEGPSRSQGSESYLAKIERPGPALRLIASEFKFEWSDHLDPAGRHYLYGGRNPGKGSSAVQLRDVTTGRDRTLVPDDGANAFSAPNFHRDGVIYVRSNALWRVSLTGSNHTRIFPPPGN